MAAGFVEGEGTAPIRHGIYPYPFVANYGTMDKEFIPGSMPNRYKGSTSSYIHMYNDILSAALGITRAQSSNRGKTLTNEGFVLDPAVSRNDLIDRYLDPKKRESYLNSNCLIGLRYQYTPMALLITRYLICIGIRQ